MTVPQYKTKLFEPLQKYQMDHPSWKARQDHQRTQRKLFSQTSISFAKDPYAVIDGEGDDRMRTPKFCINRGSDTLVLFFDQFQQSVDKLTENRYLLITVMNRIIHSKLLLFMLAHRFARNTLARLASPSYHAAPPSPEFPPPAVSPPWKIT